MTGRGAAFLSACVPEPSRPGREPLLVVVAARAFVQVVLCRRLLGWGGQSAIAPITPEAARRLDVPYRRCVLLYQNAFFNHRYRQTNLWFDNWREVPAIEGDAQASLRRLRERMLGGQPSEAAGIEGGMEGVVDEFGALQGLARHAPLIPLPAPGGVSRDLFDRVSGLPRKLRHRTDFTYRRCRLLDIDHSEPRMDLNVPIAPETK